LDAGNDFYICFRDIGGGINPPVTLNPIYQCNYPIASVEWSAEYHYGGFAVFTASDMLSDTTVLTPTLPGIPNALNFLNNLDELVFHLKVTNSQGDVYNDIIKIIISRFSIFPDSRTMYIHPGDTATIYSGIGGGVSPLTYQWIPSDYNIINSSSSIAQVFPTVDTQYHSIVTDAAGCISTYTENWPINVSFLSTESLAERQPINSSVFPNPFRESAVLQMNTDKEIRLYIYDSNGKELGSYNARNNFEIGGIVSQKGTYYYLLKDKKGTVGHGQFIKL
jgi:hypothetical protein